MRLKLYCNRYTHFKDALVCSVNCMYRTRCRDFALFYDEHREQVDTLVADYFATRRVGSASKPTSPQSSGVLPVLPVTQIATPTDIRTLISLEVKKKMAEAVYIWIDKEDRAELVSTEEVLRRAERGAQAKHIYKVAQEMELRFQLVPRQRIDKAKRSAAAEAEREQARRTRVASQKSPSVAPFPSQPEAVEPHAASTLPARRSRTRAAKAVGER